jgi:ribosomal protein L40E
MEPGTNDGPEHQPTGSTVCAGCGLLNPRSARFCQECHLPLRRERGTGTGGAERICRGCWCVNPAPSRFCRECGLPLGETETDPGAAPPGPEPSPQPPVDRGSARPAGGTTTDPE